MRDHKVYFENKKITVMGLGVLGRGVGDTAFLAECNADLIVTDMKSKEELASSIERLDQYKNITYRLDGHNEDDFKGRDLILQAAGVPSDATFLEIARKDGAEIAMSGALFAKLSGVPIIGVTGTRGKSTVAHMIHHVLTVMTEGGNVLLGGNVRGVSNLQLLNEVTEESIAVMELDSWQLQGFGYASISPQVSVFTNFMEDHLNYYKGDMDAYFADKANIFLHQEEGNVLVTTHEILERIDSFMKGKGLELQQQVVLVDTSILPEDCLLKMPGEHNRLNAAFALEALKSTGLTEEEIYEGLASFPGVPGRLEYLGEKNGIKIYNDNNATTPAATIKGIEAIATDKNVLLIAGGTYKDVDPQPLVEVIKKHCKHTVLLPGTGSDKLNESIGCEIADSLSGAVAVALEKGDPGDVLLFSPGFASFGMFANEYDRNDQFIEIIHSYEIN